MPRANIDVEKINQLKFADDKSLFQNASTKPKRCYATFRMRAGGLGLEVNRDKTNIVKNIKVHKDQAKRLRALL